MKPLLPFLIAALTCAMACDPTHEQFNEPSTARAVESQEQEQQAGPKPPERQEARDESDKVPRESTSEDRVEDESSNTHSGSDLCWEPLLDYNVVSEKSLQKSVVLHNCAEGEARVEFMEVPAGRRTPDEMRCKNGDHVFALTEGASGALVMHTFEAQTGRKMSKCKVHRNLVSRWIRFDPAAEHGILMRWGAGTALEVMVACYPDGERIAAMGPTSELSPSRRHLAIFPGKGTPRAGFHGIEIYDLRQRRRIVRKHEAVPREAYIRRIVWVEDEVIFRLGNDDKNESEIRASLNR